MNYLKNLLFGLTLLCLSLPAVAVPIVDYTGGTIQGVLAGARTYGYDFSSSTSLRVTALGIFESLARPLEVVHDLGLWDDSGVLLASTTVSGTDTAVASANPMAQWRFADIAPLVLGAGTYFVGAYYTDDNEDDILLGGAPLISLPSITYGETRFGFGPALARPTMGFGSSSLAGATIMADVIPEPTTLALMGLGLAGLGSRKRK